MTIRKPDDISDDIWNELTTQEKKERLLPKEEQDRIFKESGFIDMNQISLDVLADYLEKEYMWDSLGDGYAILKFVDFYKKYGDSPNYSIWSQLHDAVYFTCKNSHVEELVAKCRECFTIPIPDPNKIEPYYIDLEFKKGTSWGDMKEIK